MTITRPDQRSSTRLVIALGAMVGLGPLTIDMYLPALPSIVTDLGTTAPSVQLTLTGSLLGLGLGQLLVGPYSDAVGRRLPLVLGTLLHVLTSVLCAFTSDITTLTVLRVLQGIGAAATTVVAMAVVRDLHDGRRAATMISHLMLVTGVAPILAPSLGSAVLLAGSWRWVFGALALIGAALVAVAVFAVPETLPPRRRAAHALRPALQGFLTVLRDREFVVLTLVSGLAFGSVFAYISGAPFVLQHQYGLDESEFGLMFGLGAVALVGGTQLNPLLLRRFTPLQVMVAATAIATTTAGVLVFATTTSTSLTGFLVPLAIVIGSIALVTPNATALALSQHGQAAGTAASVLGAIRFGLGSAIAPVVGVLGNDSTATAVVMTGSAAAALLFTLSLRPRRSSATRQEENQLAPLPAQARG
ncbi:MFS transporter, DHA1 family, bicyclomycin/chloramphenicol resistance protein [Lentzea fradiae]|uniref:MFS transporter, DHA1 family, bicyclomycin/chloramphenicol resistance protein n=1 Tax=Lentzea fradiae TaxID=200378 RepID=A0A1G7L399_9PSEU|nr:multidrug effflux MFS transporter [Lentzea fradiae]SDF43489.1 MFS transporter, DHA1 family, bicyclomycin/chloramphenicol resistance protein [Lentzea fradiae]